MKDWFIVLLISLCCESNSWAGDIDSCLLQYDEVIGPNFLKVGQFQQRLDQISPSTPLYNVKRDSFFLKGQYLLDKRGVIFTKKALVSATNDTIQYPFTIKNVPLDSLNLTSYNHIEFQQTLKGMDNWLITAAISRGVLGIGCGMVTIGIIGNLLSIVDPDEYNSKTYQKIGNTGAILAGASGTLFVISIPMTIYNYKKAHNFIGLSNRNNFHDYLKEKYGE